jgi:hypothetical protein
MRLDIRTSFGELINPQKKETKYASHIIKTPKFISYFIFLNYSFFQCNNLNSVLKNTLIKLMKIDYLNLNS